MWYIVTWTLENKWEMEGAGATTVEAADPVSAALEATRKQSPSVKPILEIQVIYGPFDERPSFWHIENGEWVESKV